MLHDEHGCQFVYFRGCRGTLNDEMGTPIVFSAPSAPSMAHPMFIALVTPDYFSRGTQLHTG